MAVIGAFLSFLPGISVRHTRALVTMSASSNYRVVTVPILQDNYSYLLIDERKKVAAVVDPAEPAKVVHAAKNEGVTLTTILTTHKHWDHAGGNDKMKTMLPDLRVFAPLKDGIPSATATVKEGDEVDIQGSSLELQVLGTPCHTRGHVCYYWPEAKSVFTGDTLFIGGCGRFFEGRAPDMLRAMDKLAALPHDTKVFCGHEYTLANLRFAVSIEPNNEALRKKIAWSEEQRAKGLPTIPSTIAEELTYNPFMRTDVASVAKAVHATSREDVMAELRERKNNF